jgi:hypothetical protein
MRSMFKITIIFAQHLNLEHREKIYNKFIMFYGDLTVFVLTGILYWKNVKSPILKERGIVST